MNNNLSKFVLNDDKKLSDSLKKIESNKKGFVLVVNKNKEVLGTLTDGDIRRSFLKGAKLSDLAINHINKNFIFLDDKIENLESVLGVVVQTPQLFSKTIMVLLLIPQLVYFPTAHYLKELIQL